MIDNRGYFPLLPRHRIWLFSPDCDGTRFAKLFTATWKQIPLWARRRMLGMWRQHSYVQLSDDMPREMVAWHKKHQLWPRIELLPRWSTVRKNGGLAYGQVGFLGREIRFWSRGIQLLPDVAVTTIIAHELAHATQHASGFMKSLGGLDEEFDMEFVEEEADTLIEEWGFDSYAFHDWHRDRKKAK
jgi:hypothetical protein